MKKNIFIICILFYKVCVSQKIELVPTAGIQYQGMSYLPKTEKQPIDFRKSIPNLAVTVGLDVKYFSKDITHVVSAQYLALGPSFSYRNIFLDKGIIPTFIKSQNSYFLNHLLLSYGIEKHAAQRLRFVGESIISFYYSVSTGIGFNRSQEVYDSTLAPYSSHSWIIGDSYEYSSVHYTETGVGIFLSGKSGIKFYNKKKKNFLILTGFWHQGLKNMLDYSIKYGYGYLNHPQYKRDVSLNLKSRGTVFGFTLGVPLRIIR